LVEQCEASWTLRERFGVKSALDLGRVTGFPLESS